MTQPGGGNPVVVDPATGALTLGARGLPVTFDVRAGVACVCLGGATYAARPMVWRDKQMLARFAELGPAFVRKQVLSLCLQPGTVLPESEADLQDLLDLVLWVQRPQSGRAIPLEVRAVAEITLGVCRALNVRPADLDDREAPEIEALWHAAQAVHPEEARPAPPQPVRRVSAPPMDDGVRRILVVPDPPPRMAMPVSPKTVDTTPAVFTHRSVEISTVNPTPPHATSTPPPTVAVSTDGLDRAAAESSERSQPPEPALPQDGPRPTPPVPPSVETRALPGLHARNPNPGSRRDAAKAVRRFRPLNWQPGGESAAAVVATLPTRSSFPYAASTPDADPGATTSAASLPVASPLLLCPPVGESASPAAEQRVPGPNLSRLSTPWAANARNARPPSPPAVPVEPERIRLDEDETRRLFDEWSRRLAESVDELGLDEEG